MSSSNLSNNSYLRFPTLLRRIGLPLFALVVIPVLLSCTNLAPIEEYEIEFVLDPSLVGNFDSVQVKIFNVNSSGEVDTANPVQVSLFPLDEDTRRIRMTLNTKVKEKFRASVVGYGESGIVFNKQYAYTDFGVDGDTQPVDLLPPKAIPPQEITAEDLVGLVGDTLVPAVTFKPEDATNKNFVLTSSENSVVEVVGKKLVALKLGEAKITVKTEAGDLEAVFTVQVVAPSFENRILPIVKLKCAPCHIPGETFNFQDSSELVRWGASAIDRLGRKVGDGGRMPLAGAPNGDLSADELEILVKWLEGVVVPAKSVSASDMQGTLGDTLELKLSWDPPEATNQRFRLTSLDTTKAIVKGNRIIPQVMGDAFVLVEPEGLDQRLTVKVTVGSPTFLKNVLPITSFKCAPCHVPGTIRNFRDSTVLIQMGLLVIEAMQRSPDGEKLIMPVPDAPNGPLTPLELNVIRTWLQENMPPSQIGNQPSDIPLEDVAVADDSVSLGAEITPVITWVPDNASNKAYTLQSEDPKVEILEGKRIKGKGVGTAEVELVTQGERFRKSFKVKVVSISVTGISAADTVASVGDIVVPRIKLTPDNATDTEFSIVSVAAVSHVNINGKQVEAKSVGRDTLEAISMDGNHKARFEFHVLATLPKSLTAVDTFGVIGVGVTPRLIWTPKNTTNTTYTLAIPVEFAALAEISNGQVMGKAEGDVKVVALSAADPEITTTFNFRVGPIAPQSLTAIDTSGIIGKAVTPRLLWNPANTTHKGYTLSIDPADNALAEITEGRVMGKGIGNVTVTATSLADTDITTTFTFEVKPIPVASLSALDITLYSGATASAQLTVSPPEATDKRVELSLPAAADATRVDLAGTQITGKALGRATVLATTVNGGKTDEFTVTVLRPPFTGDGNILPITQAKCAGCHSITFPNVMDSVTVVANKVAILDRIQREPGSAGFMPAGSSLTPAELTRLIDWLSL